MGWLLLITEVPSKPDYLRVKLRRRVQRLGAVGLKGAVYLLPDTQDAMESLRWLRREVVADGGEATICSARFIDGISDADLVERFGRDRDGEYAEFIGDCADLAGRWAGGEGAGRAVLVAERSRLYARLEEILGRDYFHASRREEAMQGMERLAVLDIVASPATGPAVHGEFSGRIWATRAGVKVDRIASAWLIRREIDPAAQFAFVPDGAAAPHGSIRFDMFDGEFGHDGDRCSYEVLLDRFEIDKPGMRAIGQMVHDIDLHDDAFGRPETAGLASMIDGLVATISSDADRIREGSALLDRLIAGLRI